MKSLFSVAVAIGMTAHTTLTAGACGALETSEHPDIAVRCRCGVLFRKWDRDTYKIDYCSATSCGDVHSQCCTQAAIDCFSSPLSAQAQRYEDIYKVAVKQVADGDFRIVDYCEKIKCSLADINCLEPCLKETTLEDVADGLDDIATQDEFASSQDTCEDIPVKTREDYDCRIDAYRALNPSKFRIRARSTA